MRSIFLVVVLVVVLVAGCNSLPPTRSPNQLPTDSPAPNSPLSRSPGATASATAPPTADPADATIGGGAFTFGDGTWRVPQDVRPATYRTKTYTHECYWTRLSGFQSGLADWISSRIGSGYQVVTIGAEDRGFDSASCGTWTSSLTTPLAAHNLFRDGTYIVGVDIVPGSYQATNAEGCYWARLSGFGGTDGDTIQDANGENSVTIAPTDVGFTSNGCGPWTMPFSTVAPIEAATKVP